MTDFTIIEAKSYHCGQMARLLRHEHQRVIGAIGVDTHRALRATFDASSFRRAWLIDGRLAAVGGVEGCALSSIGAVWLALSDVAQGYPLAVVKEARRQLAQIMQVKHYLLTTVFEGDEASKRFAIFLGFVPVQGEASAAVSRFGRRSMLELFAENTESRVKIGTGYGVVMRYNQREAA